LCVVNEPFCEVVGFLLVVMNYDVSTRRMSEGIWKGREGTYTRTHGVSGDRVAVQVIRNNCLPQFTNQSVTQHLDAGGEGETEP
jgi:hypothetical protein